MQLFSKRVMFHTLRGPLLSHRLFQLFCWIRLLFQPLVVALGTAEVAVFDWSFSCQEAHRQDHENRKLLFLSFWRVKREFQSWLIGIQVHTVCKESISRALHHHQQQQQQPRLITQAGGINRLMQGMPHSTMNSLRRRFTQTFFRDDAQICRGVGAPLDLLIMHFSILGKSSLVVT